MHTVGPAPCRFPTWIESTASHCRSSIQLLRKARVSVHPQLKPGVAPVSAGMPTSVVSSGWSLGGIAPRLSRGSSSQALHADPPAHPQRWGQSTLPETLLLRTGGAPGMWSCRPGELLHGLQCPAHPMPSHAYRLRPPHSSSFPPLSLFISLPRSLTLRGGKSLLRSQPRQRRWGGGTVSWCRSRSRHLESVLDVRTPPYPPHLPAWALTVKCSPRGSPRPVGGGHSWALEGGMPAAGEAWFEPTVAADCVILIATLTPLGLGFFS